MRKNFYPSNIWPLFLNCYDGGESDTGEGNKTDFALRFLDYMERENATRYFPGGVPASLVEGTGYAVIICSLFIHLTTFLAATRLEKRMGKEIKIFGTLTY